jgi:hypothetical protein
VIENLGAKADVAELNRLATLTKQEQDRMGQIDAEAASLKTQNVSRQVEQPRQIVKDLGNLRDSLHKSGDF